MDSYNEYLKIMYDKLKANLILGKIPKHKSVFISVIFGIKNNDRYRLLKESAIPRYELPKDVFNHLLNKKYIRDIDNLDEYALSARGIWEYEQKSNVINIDDLIDYLEKEKIKLLFTTPDLKDKEKLVIFMLIMARSFSEKSQIDLKKNEMVLEALDSLIEKAYDVLNELKIIKEPKDKVYRQSENEHSIYSFMRHNDPLPRKTKDIYAYTRNQGYYLNLFKNEIFSKENLTYLLWILFKFNPEISISDAEKISNILNDVSYDKSAYIYDLNTHIFANPEYDDILKECIREAIIMANETDTIK